METPGDVAVGLSPRDGSDWGEKGVWDEDEEVGAGDAAEMGLG